MKSSILNPAQIAWLAATFKRNRELYGGMTMMADDEGGKPDDGKQDDKKGDVGKDGKSGTDDDKKGSEDGKSDDDFKNEFTKANALADLTKERDERKKLQSELTALKEGLGQALGLKADDKDKDSDVLATVQQQLAAMQHESAVLRLANEHRITDKDDLEILGTAKDQDSMKKLAERLAPSENEDDDKKGKRPKADRTQGGGSDGDNKGTAGGSVAQVMAERRAARAEKTKS